MDSRPEVSTASQRLPRSDQKRVAFPPAARKDRQSLSQRGRYSSSSLAEKIGFLLFILVNAALFLRPSELFPDLGEAPIYEVLILTCLLFSCGAVFKQLQPARLRDQP